MQYEVYVRARYSPVAPARLMRELLDANLIGDYQLVLAHEVVEQHHLYDQFEKRFTGKYGRAGYIILDNSLIELGGSVPLELMKDACAIVRPNFVVLPDVLQDRKQSVKALTEAYWRWQQCLSLCPQGAGFMAIVQGADNSELMQCADEYMKVDEAKKIIAFGIPRAHENSGHSRALIARDLWNKYKLPMHMMGFSNNFPADMRAAVATGVMGIDSATPLRAGFEHMAYEHKGITEHMLKIQRKNFFELATKITPAMAHNIGYIRGLLDERSAINEYVRS